MQPAIRTQVDGLNEQYSRSTGLDCSNLPDKTRQEFKQETDVNYILGRFGARPPMQQPEYGAEIDYDLDLQQAIASVQKATEALNNLPTEIAAKYPNITSLARAMAAGQLQKDLEEFNKNHKEKKDLTEKGTRTTVQDNPNRSDNEATDDDGSLRDDPDSQETWREGRRSKNRKPTRDN